MSTELKQFPPVMETGPDTFVQDEPGNLIGTKVCRDGIPFPVEGQVSVLFTKPDQTSIELDQNGSISGNRVSFELPSVFYEQIGAVRLALILTNGQTRTTLGVICGTVYPTRL